MSYDKSDPALDVVKRRFAVNKTSAAYYDVFTPRRNETITQQHYNQSVLTAVNSVQGTFGQYVVQGEEFTAFDFPGAAVAAWANSGGWDFLHINRNGTKNFRVYIPADLRRMGEIIHVLSSIDSVKGFKVAGYLDANNRSDVVIAWVSEIAGVFEIANRISNNMLHGMRPPGSTIIAPGCLIGYSEEVAGSSVGTEVVADLTK